MASKLETAKKFMGHFATLDMQVLEEILAEDYFHQFAPASIKPPGPFDKAGFIAHLTGLKAMLSGFPVEVKEWIVHETGVVAWATSKTIFREEAKDSGIPAGDWDFVGEYVFMLTMNEAGEVVKCVEFLDSKATADGLMVLAGRAKENLSKGK